MERVSLIRPIPEALTYFGQPTQAAIRLYAHTLVAHAVPHATHIHKSAQITVTSTSIHISAQTSTIPASGCVPLPRASQDSGSVADHTPAVRNVSDATAIGAAGYASTGANIVDDEDVEAGDTMDRV